MALREDFAARWREKVELAAEDIRQGHVDAYNARLAQMLKKCESPIEEMLGAELLLINDGYSGVSEWIAHWPSPMPPEFGTVLGSQITLGDYRVDFLFEVRNFGDKAYLAVECDGHDFHDRTKQQAARDKRRDRWMTARGIRVLRFTGSEIFKDAEKCAIEVEGALMHIMDDLFKIRKPAQRAE